MKAKQYLGLAWICTAISFLLTGVLSTAIIVIVGIGLAFKALIELEKEQK